MTVRNILPWGLAAILLLAGHIFLTEAQGMDQQEHKGQAQKIVQTAGRDRLGDFAPDFARYNDDILFGEVWSRNDKLSLHDRSIVTVSALIASGMLDSSLKFHLASAKKNGVTKEEMVEIITQLGFYAGWPKAWAAFGMAKEVYAEEK
ncbi:MAG: carboxymuconolactone decarboxylase family protein [Desulfovibrio sp.]|nr:carboxymuconolactone decarboxylase family protein [Desulfovibrio sp.]